MKWKCTECVPICGLDTGGCTLDVGHLDESADGPGGCPWASGETAMWEPMNEPIDKAIRAATPALCHRCTEPALLDNIGYCMRCLRETGGV